MKVLVAMSGGVDSSVAAALLIKTAEQCAGATMKLFDAEENAVFGAKSCCALSDVNDARDIAYRLGIPHYVLNLKKEFEREVIQKFIDVYEEGGTPNPCIDCNRVIKFKEFLQRARQLEFETIATGHYARIEKSGSRYILLKGRDAHKDQSYVLYTMTQEQLASTLLPLGVYTKEDVREIARANNFITAEKHESQDICFVPDGDYTGFMERRRGAAYPYGDILDCAGNIIGRHKGFVRYTIGQRRGTGIAAGTPCYVCAKSAKDNTITIGAESSLYTKSLIAKDCNFIALEGLEKPLRVQVKTRYQQSERMATAWQISPTEFKVDFEIPERALASGQAVVIYDGDVVIAGGTIV